MPRTYKPAEFTARLAAMPRAIEQATHDAVAKAALELTQEARRNIAAASGGDSRLSGVGKRGARVTARYDVKGTKNPTALIRANGPWQLVENDTRPHEIDARRTRTGRKRSKATGALNTPYGPKAKVQHPGTRGKHPWKRAVDRVLPHSQRLFQTELRRALAKTFR